MPIMFRSGLSGWAPTRASVEDAGFIVTTKTAFNDGDVVINWGSTTPLTGGLVLNPPENVDNCRNKLRTIELLGEKMPQTWTTYDPTIPVPFVMKKNYTHKGFGKRLVHRHRMSRVDFYKKFDYYQPYIDIEEEYRVLVFNDGKKYTIPRIYMKVKTDAPSSRPHFHPVWEFQKQTLSEVDTRIRETCLDSIRELGMHLVGFDVVRDSNDKIFIIEANSAPGLGPNTASKLYRKLHERYG